jgi:hypothetical protein
MVSLRSSCRFDCPSAVVKSLVENFGSQADLHISRRRDSEDGHVLLDDVEL